MPISDFANMMTQTITRIPVLSRDDYGKITDGASSTYTARVVRSPHTIVSFDGEEIIAGGEAWVQTTDSFSNDDTITLAGVNLEILSIDNIPDDDGSHHIKLHFR